MHNFHPLTLHVSTRDYHLQMTYNRFFMHY